MLPSSEPTRPVKVPAVRLSDEELLQAVVARGEDATDRKSSLGLLLLTAVLFVALGGLRWGWQTVVYLAVAVALHETGHVIAMRVFGYKHVRMLFLPLFGGLAAGEPRELDATRNGLVALAGPVVGLLTALLAAMVAVFVGNSPWLVHFAWISLLLNAFNLLPLVPLDGGRFANDVLFSRYPILELTFRGLAVAGLAWLALRLHALLLGTVAAFMLITTPQTFRRAQIVRGARNDPMWATRELDLETIGLLRAMVTQLFARVPPAKYERALPEHVHQIWLEIRKRYPDPERTLLLVVSYLACLAAVAAIAVFLVNVQRSMGK